MNFHARITLKSSDVETKCDMSEADLQSRIIKPYEDSSPIILNGKTIRSEEIERVQISKSDSNSAELIAQINAENMGHALLDFTPEDYRAAERADDVTDDFIHGAPGFRAPQISEQTAESDTIYGAILTLIDSSRMSREFKQIVKSDINESQRSYSAKAFKASVVMLGAALEGLMLGTL